LVTNNNGLPSFFRFWKANGVPLEEILNLPPPPSPMNFGGWRRVEERRGEGDLLVKVNVDY
jgi:hypothetical protein